MTGALIAAYSTPLFIAIATLAVNQRVQAMPRWFRITMVSTMVVLASSVALSVGLSRDGTPAGTAETVFSLLAVVLALTMICAAAGHVLLATDSNDSF
jgi:lysylphosphatidylglycerol synthetase-like protein (DUF2156 family)